MSFEISKCPLISVTLENTCFLGRMSKYPGGLLNMWGPTSFSPILRHLDEDCIV